MQPCGERHNEQAGNHEIEILDKRLLCFHTAQFTYGLRHMAIAFLNIATHQDERPKYQGDSHAARNKVDRESIDSIPDSLHVCTSFFTICKVIL
jgi:hypothetical protein